MSVEARWALSAAEQERYIAALTGELAALRAKLGITQSELAYLVGVSRQTYSATESGRKPMSWSAYLSLVLFFDYNLPTRQMLRSCGAFPKEMVERFNEGKEILADNIFRANVDRAREAARMMQALDEQGIQSIRTTLLVEYARCTGTTKRVLQALEPKKD